MMAGEEFFKRAYGLAFFLHPNEGVAFDVALEAVARLEVTAQRQERRRRYRPVGRRASGGPRRPSRYRVAFDRAQLLQLLVYIASEPREKCQEQGPSEQRPADEDMTVRFIAYLVRICLQRNAFHTALGIGRLLHDYSTEEVMALHDLVVQDPERYCTDDYLRERKKVILGQLQKRFAGWVETHNGPRGEKRFRSQELSALRIALVRRALETFTPWQSHCRLPEHFDPVAEEIPALRFKGTAPDDEHPVERRRIHALVHPPCLAQLIVGLGFAGPDERLTVPMFFGLRDDDGPSQHDRSRPPELLQAAFDVAKDNRLRRASRRRLVSGTSLSVRVDGSEALRWDVLQRPRARLEVDGEAERVEVWAIDEPGEDVLLALYLVSQGGDGSVRLEAGQSIRFRVETVAEPLDEALQIEVTYRERRADRAVALAGRRLSRWLSMSDAGFKFHQRTVGWGALAGAAVVALVIGGGLLFTPSDRNPWDVVRGSSAPAGVPLAEIERVFVQSLGDESFHQRLRSRLVANLETRPGWQVLDSTRQAQAVLRLAEHGRSTTDGAVTLRLVNRGGEVIWEESFEGAATEIAALAVVALDEARAQGLARQSP